MSMGRGVGDAGCVALPAVRRGKAGGSNVENDASPPNSGLKKPKGGGLSAATRKARPLHEGGHLERGG
jgi:hypothetical protein